MRKIVSWVCIITLLFAISSVVSAEENVSVTLTATSYKTDGVLVPSISGISGEATYRYLMADKADAPNLAWEEITYDNANVKAKGTIESSESAGGAYLLLTAKQAGKYIKLEVTSNGATYYSPVTEKIEYTPNKLNNGELNVRGINLETGEVYGWTDGTYDSRRLALKSGGAVNGNNWYNKFDFPMNITAGNYKFSLSSAYASGAGKNFRANYSGNDIGNGKWTAGKQMQFTEVTTFTHTVSETIANKENPSISFRLCTSASEGAENFWMKDLSLIKEAPFLEDVSIVGDFSVWETIRADYTYNGTYDASGTTEDEPIVKWYSSKNNYGPWEELLVSGKSVVLPSGTYGKYIKAEVTPVNSNGVKGDTFFAISNEKVGIGQGVVLSAVDDRYKTDGILYPEYISSLGTEEGTSTYRYLMSDKADAPISAWEEIQYSNDEIIIGTEITSEKAKNAYLLLSQEMVGKYIRVEITPKDKEGNAYAPILSDPTPMIEYSPNLINNPTFSREAVDADGNVMGWSNSGGNAVTLVDDKNGVTASGALAIRPAADEVGYDFRTKMILPAKFGTYGLKYNIDYDVYKITSGNTNYRMKVGNNAMLAVMGGNNTHNKKWIDVIGVYESNAGNANSGNIGFAMSGSAGGAAGQFNVDNVSITEVAPYVENISLSQKAMPLRTVEGKYDYISTYDADGAVEEGSTYKWYVSDNGYASWTEVANSKEFEIPQSYEGKYLKFAVTPKSSAGTIGYTQSIITEVLPPIYKQAITDDNPYLAKLKSAATAEIKKAQTDISTASDFFLVWAYTDDKSQYQGDEEVLGYVIDAMTARCNALETTPEGHWNTIFDSLLMLMEYENSGISNELFEKWKTQAKASAESLYNSVVNGGNTWTNRAANTLAQSASILQTAYMVYGDEKYATVAKECARKVAVNYQKEDGGYTYLDDSAATRIYLDFTTLYLGRYYQLSEDDVAGKSLKKYADYAKYYSIGGNLEGSSSPWWKKAWGTNGSLHGTEVAAGISGDKTARKVASIWQGVAPVMSYDYYAMYFYDTDIEIGEIPQNLNEYSDTLQGGVFRRGVYQAVTIGAPYSDSAIGVSVSSETENRRWQSYLETAGLGILGKDATLYDSSSGVVSGIGDLAKQDSVICNDYIAIAKTYDLKHAYTGSTTDPSGKGAKSTQVWYADENGVGGYIEIELTAARKNIDGPQGVLKLSDIVEINENEISSKALNYKIFGENLELAQSENSVYINFDNGGSRNYSIGEKFGYGLSVAQTGKTLPTVVKTNGDLFDVKIEGEKNIRILFNPTGTAITLNPADYSGYTNNGEAIGIVSLEPYKMLVLEETISLSFDGAKVVATMEKEVFDNAMMIVSLVNKTTNLFEASEVVKTGSLIDGVYTMESKLEIPSGNNYILNAYLWNKEALYPYTTNLRRDLGE